MAAYLRGYEKVGLPISAIVVLTARMVIEIALGGIYLGI